MVFLIQKKTTIEYHYKHLGVERGENSTEILESCNLRYFFVNKCLVYH